MGGLILVALGVGAVGYHFLDDLPWLDAALNAAMILTGMGPVNPIRTPAAKVFAIVYALLSGVFFLTMVAVLLAPALHHFLHRFHLELSEREQAKRRHENPTRLNRSTADEIASATSAVRGTLRVDSSATHGTRIDAWVPAASLLAPTGEAATIK